MATVLISVVILVLLIISFVSSYRAMESTKGQGNNATKATVMVGIDIILVVLIIVTLLSEYI